MAKKYTLIGGILKRLLFDKDMKAADLARKINIPPPTIHRLITGKSSRPYQSSLQPIADYFSITLNQLLGEEPLQIEPFPRNETNKILQQDVQTLPLIPWEHLQLLEIGDKINYNSIAFVGGISKSGFATILNDSSMEPIFNRGCILILDPKKTAKDRSYVLVQFHEPHLIVFRQLLVDLEHKYLKPLNPDLSTFKMKLLGEKDKIIGTLIEARQTYNEY